MLPLVALVALSASASAVVATGQSSSGSSGWSRGFDGARESFLETVLEANVSNQKSCKVRRTPPGQYARGGSLLRLTAITKLTRRCIPDSVRLL